MICMNVLVQRRTTFQMCGLYFSTWWWSQNIIEAFPTRIHMFFTIYHSWAVYFILGLNQHEPTNLTNTKPFTKNPPVPLVFLVASCLSQVKIWPLESWISQSCTLISNRNGWLGQLGRKRCFFLWLKRMITPRYLAWTTVVVLIDVDTCWPHTGKLWSINLVGCKKTPVKVGIPLF